MTSLLFLTQKTICKRQFVDYIVYQKSKVNVKQSHYMPGQALRVPGGWDSQISRQSAHESSKVFSPTHRPPWPTRKYSWYSFLLEPESTPGPKCGRRIMSMKNYNDIIGNRTRDLAVFSTVPQPTAPPRASISKEYNMEIATKKKVFGFFGTNT